MAYIPNSSSVIAFQSDPTKLVGTVSVVGNMNSSVAVVSTAPHSVATLQGTNPWMVQLTSGSVITTGGNSSVQVVGLMPPQSVSGVGTFNINPVGNGSVIATLTNSSVTALQGTNPWAVQLTSGSILTTVGNSSVQLLGGSNVIGSVATLQGTNPWVIQPTSGSVIAYQLAGSVMAVNATVNTGNSSVQVLGGNAMIGSIAAYQGVSPWTVQLSSGSIITTGGNSSVQVVGLMPPQSVSGVGTFNIDPIGAGSIIAKLTNSSVTTLQGTNPWFVQLTSGSVITTGGNSSVQVVGILPNTSVSGVGQFNVNHTGNGSVLVLALGSIATAPFPASVSGVGIFNVNHIGNGSIQTVWTNPSIAGTYQEDGVHTSADRGIFVLGVRNDAVASFVSANGDYTPFGHDSAGRVLMKPFAPEESRIQGVSSTVNTNPSSLIAAAGAGLRNYITDLWIANTGSVSTLVTFRDGDASIIGKTIAPAGGGSNIPAMQTPMRTNALNSQIEFTAGTATSILHVTAFGFKAP